MDLSALAARVAFAKHLMSFEAVLKLRKRWKTHRLQHGLPECKAAGLPVDSSS